MHTPVQVTHRFNGGPILSVPITPQPRPARLLSSSLGSAIRTTRKPETPIHEVLFEESVQPREDIDPWGYSRNETVVRPDAVFRGLKLTVSRLHSSTT
jgi:hypothetical protein